MKKPIISVLFGGGLGNQLFQFFATLSYGLTHSLEIIFPNTVPYGVAKLRTCKALYCLFPIVHFKDNVDQIFSQTEYSHQTIDEQLKKNVLNKIIV